MKRLTFKEKDAQRIYNRYMDKSEKLCKILAKDDREDLLMELNSHIYEGINRSENEGEVANLLDVLDGLGDPDEYLKSQVAEMKALQASRTFNPKHVIQALFLNISNGIFYTVIAILYLLLGTFIAAIIGKILFPSKMGFYIGEGHFMLGTSNTVNPNDEVLGMWFIPVILIVALGLYFLITLLFRLKKRK